MKNLIYASFIGLCQVSFAGLALVNCGPIGTDPLGTVGVEAGTGATVRVVNLFSTGNGMPGPAVDVYRMQSAQMGARVENAPIVSAVAYGTVSATFRLRAGFDQLRYYNAGTQDKTAGFAGFIDPTNTLTADDKVTIVIAGDKAGSGTTLIPGWQVIVENTDANSPAVDPANALIAIDPHAIDAYDSQDPGSYLGSGGTCLSSRHQPAGSDPNFIGFGEIYAFSPGNLSLGLFLNPVSGIADCSGTSDFGPITISGAAAGSRYWLIPYGESWTQRKVLTLPFL